jgi:hypothetical protein
MLKIDRSLIHLARDLLLKAERHFRFRARRGILAAL